jgi:hypothetical protein
MSKLIIYTIIISVITKNYFRKAAYDFLLMIFVLIFSAHAVSANAYKQIVPLENPNILFFQQTSFHDIHISVIDINAISSNKVEIKIKTFYDDLVTSMGLIPGDKLPSKYKGPDDLIIKFVEKNLKFSMDNKAIKPIYAFSKASNPAIWTTLEVDNIDLNKIKEIKIENTLLLKVHDDQVNIVNVNILGQKESYSLDSKTKQALFKIKH